MLLTSPFKSPGPSRLPSLKLTTSLPPPPAPSAFTVGSTETELDLVEANAVASTSLTNLGIRRSGGSTVRYDWASSSRYSTQLHCSTKVFSSLQKQHHTPFLNLGTIPIILTTHQLIHKTRARFFFRIS